VAADCRAPSAEGRALFVWDAGHARRVRRGLRVAGVYARPYHTHPTGCAVTSANPAVNTGRGVGIASGCDRSQA